MVNFFNKIKSGFNFLRISFHLLKFAFVLGRSSDGNAKMLITQARWRINQQADENVKNQLLDFIKKMEETRFPDEK